MKEFVSYGDYLSFASAGPEQLIPEELWSGIERRARDLVDYYKSVYAFREVLDCAYGYEEDTLTNTQRAICAVASELYSYALARSGGEDSGVSALSVGSVSVSFGKTSASASMDLSEKAASRAAYNAANRYLHFYRGVD